MSTEMNKNQRSDKCIPNAITETLDRVRKPLVLSSQRYKKIMNNATNYDQSKTSEFEEEQRNLEQLKKGNDELVAQFSGNMQTTQEQKLQKIKEEMEKKIKQENEEHKRQDKIARAQQLMERLKPGPREHPSAVLESEVLRARNVQRNINEEFAKAIKKQEFENNKIHNEQMLNWIGEEQKRLEERQKNKNAYKQELLQTINDNQKQRSEQRKQLIREQQAAREATDLEVKAQIEKEKAIMEKKRAALRKNTLEAMKMVEQRRLRDHMVEEVEDRLCCVYNSGRNHLNNLRAEQAKKLFGEKQKKIEIEAKKLTKNEEIAKAVETERMRRDITTMQLKFTAEEQEKIRKDKATKQARIETYLKEMEQEKELKCKIEEEKRFEMARRFKNDEVNCIFNEAKREERHRQVLEVRSQLNQQIEENKNKKLPRKHAVQTYSRQQ